MAWGSISDVSSPGFPGLDKWDMGRNYLIHEMYGVKDGNKHSRWCFRIRQFGGRRLIAAFTPGTATTATSFGRSMHPETLKFQKRPLAAPLGSALWWCKTTVEVGAASPRRGSWPELSALGGPASMVAHLTPGSLDLPEPDRHHRRRLGLDPLDPQAATHRQITEGNETSRPKHSQAPRYHIRQTAVTELGVQGLPSASDFSGSHLWR